ADGVRALGDAGARHFLEIGPDAVLTPFVEDAVPLLRRDRDEETAAVTALARLYTAGVPVDWPAFFAGTGARRVDLPTYPFQRERYWPTVSASATDLFGVGLDPTGHPLLGAAVTVADTGELVATGTLSASQQPWLTEHRVAGTASLPGTGFLELAVRAGDLAGCDRVEELTVDTPLVLPAQGAVQVQMRVGAPDEEGRRTVRCHARPTPGDTPWQLHATGVLSRSATPATAFDSTVWPPTGATGIDPADTHERWARAGIDHGPAFQGRRGVWRRGEEVYTEAVLPEPARGDDGFGLHPALLDAVLHARVHAGQESYQRTLPVGWRGAVLHASGATVLRARIVPTGPDTVALAATDLAGRPVLTVDSVTLRPVADHAPAGAAHDPLDSLLRLEWIPAPAELTPATGARWAVVGDDRHDLGQAMALAGEAVVSYGETLAAAIGQSGDNGPVPHGFLVCVHGGEEPEAVHETVHRVLALLQDWLAEPRLDKSRLVLVTRGAMALEGEDVTDPAATAVWGLVRSAQSEHPGRFVLVDLDDAHQSAATLPALFLADEEQWVVRERTARVPRLARVPEESGTGDPAPWHPEGTVLITGGTGGLGADLARHLVATHGVQHLLLAGRSGESAPGAADLRAELTGAGAKVTIAACDVADADAVDALLAEIPAEHPLTAVVHTAGVLDDGVLTSLTPERVSTVLRPKADAAWHLHRATRDLDLAAFVLYSSVSGVLGSQGQSGYAAGNAYLDALAAHRRRGGLPATSLAWGMWASRTGMTAALTDTDLQRMVRSGLPPIGRELGLALFDAALRRDEPQLVPLHVDRSRTPRQVAAVLRGLIAAPRRTAAATTPSFATLRDRLGRLDDAERERTLLDLVVGISTVLLGRKESTTVEPEREFLTLGFDSLIALELCNQLGEALGLRVPTAAVFENRTPLRLAQWLDGQLAHQGGQPADPGTLTAGTRQNSPDSLVTLFFDTVGNGKSLEAMRLLIAVAATRPQIELTAEVPELPRAITLADGPAQPRLICVSAPGATGGPHQYARLAAPFRGRRHVSALPLLGFAEGEPLPATSEAAARLVAESVLLASDGEPFVLVGYSTGGTFAHRAAGILEQTWGVRPEGIVMLDTLSLGYREGEGVDWDRVQDNYLAGIDRPTVKLDTARLSAMAYWFIRMTTGDAESYTTDVPSLLIRCADSLPGVGDEQAPAVPADVVRVIQADHHTLIAEDSAETARLMDEWLVSLRAGGN
ncbi:type I polyketide synthase, partial [Streptomyces sp. NPDC050619]|uniref:type I polyketide synthase n=1 Tax=Streptomyces sp. NPDC050619 TaxID=3157214 RepID=UPI00343882FD